MTSLGLDIGGSSVKAAALGDDGVLVTAHSERYARPARDALLRALSGAVEQLGPGVGRTAMRVGLCAPGVLDAERRRIERSVNVPGLEGLDLHELVREVLAGACAVPLITSDARAAAHDVWATRRTPGRLLAISIGTGLGASVLDDGTPLRVSGESPGHLGQVDVGPIDGVETPVGPDGGRGSLEGYIGLPALLQRHDGADIERAIEALDERDPGVRALARAIRIAHAIYRPHAVVLLGGVGMRLGNALPGLRRLVETELTGLARPGWTLEVGWTEFHAAIGAARLAAG